MRYNSFIPTENPYNTSKIGSLNTVLAVVYFWQCKIYFVTNRQKGLESSVNFSQLQGCPFFISEQLTNSVSNHCTSVKCHCVIVSEHCMNSGWSTSTFLSLSLFVVIKSNPKRPDKKNSLRLRLLSNIFLSQRNYLFTLRAHGKNVKYSKDLFFSFSLPKLNMWSINRINRLL